MENLSHSLIGAALAEVTLPAAATPAQRRLFFVAGIVAANLPDADLLYARITPPPLGYLLHHRGHTHTLVGCAALGVLIWIATRTIGPLRRVVDESPARFWTLIVAALASHLLADAWNSYGVHPFWPFDDRWVYGDAIFILEPWFWVTLGAAAAANTRSAGGKRILIGGLLLLPLALAGVGLIPVSAVFGLFAGAAMFVAVIHRLSPRQRSAAALSVVALFVAAMFGLNRVARAAAVQSLGSDLHGNIVDVILSPAAAQPFCWSTLIVEDVEASDEYVMHRGNVDLIPRLSGHSCTGTARTTTIVDGSRGAVAWTAVYRGSLSRLRERSRTDCWTRAWLQFGRAPVLSETSISDARFGAPGGGNFTEMSLRPLAAAAACPPNLTHWAMPRADLIAPPAAR